MDRIKDHHTSKMSKTQKDRVECVLSCEKSGRGDMVSNKEHLSGMEEGTRWRETDINGGIGKCTFNQSSLELCMNISQ